MLRSNYRVGVVATDCVFKRYSHWHYLSEFSCTYLQGSFEHAVDIQTQHQKLQISLFFSRKEPIYTCIYKYKYFYFSARSLALWRKCILKNGSGNSALSIFEKEKYSYLLIFTLHLKAKGSFFKKWKHFFYFSFKKSQLKSFLNWNIHA